MKRSEISVRITKLKSAGQSKAAYIAFMVSMICLLVIGIYRLFTAQHLGAETYVALLGLIIYRVCTCLFGVPERPTYLFKNPLPLGRTKKELGLRLKAYSVESLLFGLLCGGIGGMSMYFDPDLARHVAWAGGYIPGLGVMGFVLLLGLFMCLAAFVVVMLYKFIANEYFIIPRLNKVIAAVSAELEDEAAD